MRGPAQTLDELQRARAHTDALFELVARETLYERPIADRHRLIFYLGHLDAFDWNQVARGVFDERSFNPSFDRLFEAGIDPPPGQAPQDRAADWPGVDDVLGYVRTVRARLDRRWDEAPPERQWVAIEHRWMHAETLCYLLHRLPDTLKRGTPQGEQPHASPPAHDYVEIPAGSVRLGQRADAFGWDNEFPAFTAEVPAFEINRHKITNAQYLRFVADGGAAPPFWRDRDGRWWLKRMFDEIPLPADVPVYATHEQARQFAEWSGGRLPSEEQWQRAAYGGDDRLYPWGDAGPDATRGLFDFAGWDPVAVSAHPKGASPYGVEQMNGNGWEWTCTPFAGFEGFAARSYYPGYSANFFDGDHWVLKGSSPRTAGRLLRRSFRNWFRGNYPHAYTTFRLVRN